MERWMGTDVVRRPVRERGRRRLAWKRFTRTISASRGRRQATRAARRSLDFRDSPDRIEANGWLAPGGGLAVGDEADRPLFADVRAGLRRGSCHDRRQGRAGAVGARARRETVGGVGPIDRCVGPSQGDRWSSIVRPASGAGRGVREHQGRHDQQDGLGQTPRQTARSTGIHPASELDRMGRLTIRPDSRNRATTNPLEPLKSTRDTPMAQASIRGCPRAVPDE